MTDRELIIEIGKNNDVAFGILIKKYEKLVFSTSYKLVQNTTDAEDICQDVFLKVYKSIHQLKSETDISGWLFKITYNISLSFLRKKNPAKANPLNDINSEYSKNALNSPLIENQTPIHTLEQKEAAEELFKAIDELPEKQKKALLLHKFEELSHKETGDLMNLSKTAVESLIYRAKSNLRKSLLAHFNHNHKTNHE